MAIGVVRPGRDLRRDLADESPELALERSDAGLTGVAADDRADHRVRDRDLVGRETGSLELAGQQVAAGDEDLLVLGVAVEADELHPVEQRSGDRVGDVGRGDEHHLGQVEVDLEVVVAERVVLGRVEHLEQRGGRVARPCRRR